MSNKYDFRKQSDNDSGQEYTCKYCGKTFMASANSESEYCSMKKTVKIECLDGYLSGAMYLSEADRLIAFEFGYDIELDKLAL